MVLPLSQIQVGERVKVVWVASERHVADRLASLGFVPKEEISCVLGAGRGGMRAYRVRGAVIALREENIGEIFVQVNPSAD